MNIRKIKRGIAFALIFAMAVTGGCGKKETENGDGNSLASDSKSAVADDEKNYIYRFEELSLPFEGDISIDNDSVEIVDDTMYLYARSYYETDGEFQSHEKILKLTKDSDTFDEIDLKTGENESYNRFTCDNEGNIYLLKEVWGSDENRDENASSEESDSATEVSAEETNENTEESDSLEYDEEEATSSDSYLVKLSSDGTRLWSVKLKEDEKHSYINDIKFIKDIGVVTIAGGVFDAYNPSDGSVEELFKRKTNEDYYEGGLLNLRDGKSYLYEYDSNYDSHIYEIDKNTRTVGNEVRLPDSVSMYSLYPGKSYDFYTSTVDSLYGVNFGDDKTTKVCDFTASDALFSNVNFVRELSEGNLIIYGNRGDDSWELCRMEKVAPEDVVEKKTLTIGMTDVYDMVRKQVVKFNQTNDEYRIKIVNYSGETEDDYDKGSEKLKLDIISGNAPDLLVMEYDMPWKSYVSKGVIEPLDSYLENDEELKNEKLLENVIDAMKVNGKNYFIVPCFSIATCIGAKDVLGDNTVTLQNYEDICNNKGVNPGEGMGYYVREYGDSLYDLTCDYFIDYETGKCNFNSDGFIDLIKMIKGFPTFDELNDSNKDYETYETYYRENKSLLMQTDFYDFDYYQAVKKGYFGKDIVFNGYPGDNDSKSFITPRLQVCMTSNCKDKDAAWQFLRGYLTDDYQNHIDYGFPVNEEAFDALVLKAQEKPYYIDSNGEKVETNSSWDIGGTEVEITELTKEEAESFANFIKSVDTALARDYKVTDIIKEEVGAFYSGQKSAEEVADIIQSRVSIYLSESM